MKSNISPDLEINITAHILTIANTIASKYKCVVEEIDFENRVINIVGSDQNQVECAKELGTILHEYLL